VRYRNGQGRDGLDQDLRVCELLSYGQGTIIATYAAKALPYWFVALGAQYLCRLTMRTDRSNR
jgi:hypothetical protein